MIRRLLCACAGAALVGALALPAPVTAKPPDLPQDDTITVTPVVSPPAPFFGLGKLLNVSSDPPQPTISDDVLKDAHHDYGGVFYTGCPPTDLPRVSVAEFYSCGRNMVVEDIDWWKWCISLIARRQQSPPPEQNDGYIHTIATGAEYVYQVMDDTPTSGKESPSPAIEVLPMPHEVADVTCPYLRQKMMDRQTCQIADPDMGRDVIENLNRLKRADKLLDRAKELARAGYIDKAIECCAHAAELCPGSPCAKRAADTLINLALGFDMPSDASEEASEPQPNSEIVPEKKSPPIDYEFEVGSNADGGWRMCADCSLGGNVYHLRYKHGCLSIWRTPDSGK